MAKSDAPAHQPATENAFAGLPSAPAAPRHSYSGVGAKIQGRPGHSLDHMASKMHPGAK